MPTELHWRPSFSASALHAAKAIVDGRPLADPRLGEALGPSANDLQRVIDSHGLPSEATWRHLVPLSATIESNRQLAQVTVAKLVGQPARAELMLSSIAQAITSVEGALRTALPRLDEELPLRVGPLREQWEARGPGLLFRLKKITEEGLLPMKADVVVMHPAIGGAGEAFLSYNTVLVEGVLANPHPELPETVRLGWLIAQLNADLPKYGEPIHADRLPHIARFAMLPPVLQAAEDVELVHDARALMARAVEAWDLVVPSGVDAAQLLSDWWSTYLDDRPPFGVAMAALDQMFG
jgi:hypothetical protein